MTFESLRSIVLFVVLLGCGSHHESLVDADRDSSDDELAHYVTDFCIPEVESICARSEMIPDEHYDVCVANLAFASCTGATWECDVIPTRAEARTCLERLAELRDLGVEWPDRDRDPACEPYLGCTTCLSYICDPDNPCEGIDPFCEGEDPYCERTRCDLLWPHDV